MARRPLRSPVSGLCPFGPPSTLHRLPIHLLGLCSRASSLRPSSSTSSIRAVRARSSADSTRCFGARAMVVARALPPANAVSPLPESPPSLIPKNHYETTWEQLGNKARGKGARCKPMSRRILQLSPTCYRGRTRGVISMYGICTAAWTRLSKRRSAGPLPYTSPAQTALSKSGELHHYSIRYPSSPGTMRHRRQRYLP